MSKSDFIFNKVNKFLEWFLILIFALLVLDVLFQVFSRYILGTSFTWTEEFARFSLIWMTILGAAYLNAKREHLSMDFLYQKFSEKNKRKASILIEVLIFLFALAVMVIGGFNLVYTTLHLEQLSGTLRIPLGYIYAIMPFSGLLIMSFSIYHISKINSNKTNNSL
jgi:TRAP-type C4-dicarboxylate transport system permease small subunit